MIQPTNDAEFIKLVATNPQVWPFISDDNSNMANFEMKDSILYLAASEGDELLGYFALSVINSICYEIHTVMLPSAWGRVLKYAKEVLVWVFTNTDCKKVITFVPENNQKALSLAERSGMKREGFLEKSFLKNGELLGQYILGAENSICH